MQVEFKRDPEQLEPKLTITAADLTDEVDELLRSLERGRLGTLAVFAGERVLLLPPEEAVRFFADGKGVSVQCARGVFSVRERLYALEERLDPRVFVRISHSEIVNLRKVTALDLTLTGTIKMTLAEGAVCWVSRRYVKRIKRALGL